MTVYAVRQGSCVNNFAIETAEINIEVKHHLLIIPPYSPHSLVFRLFFYLNAPLGRI